MRNISQNTKIAQLISKLEQKSIERRLSLQNQLQNEKKFLSKSFRETFKNTQSKQEWSNHLKKRVFFQPEGYNPYKFIPKYKNQQLIFPDRVLEKGNKRFFIKMKDSSIDSFPVESQPEKYKQFIKKDQKDQIITNRKLSELNRILETNDGRIRSRRYKKMIQNRYIFKTPCVSDYFNQYPGNLKQSRLPQQELKEKISLSRTHEKNSWRPSTRTQQSFSQQSGSSEFTKVLITQRK